MDSCQMALYLKQDFTPPVLSRKWIAMKFRPNMLIYNREHIISILESGLLFREDSIEVEQETPEGAAVWSAGGGEGGWLTRGEKVASATAVALAFALAPPKSFNRTTLFHLAAYLSLPVAIRFAHRRACKGTLQALLAVMRDYLTLARRAAACLREYAALRADLGIVGSVLESARSLLCRQQSELCVSMSRASSALLGNVPWLRADVAWDAIDTHHTDNLMKIHHAFLVVQSTLLKHIALAHFIPSPRTRQLYKNYNERIYWIHDVLIRNITDEFTQNYQALDRMYRLLKNYGNSESNDKKTPGKAINDRWLYSDVHSDIARANLELKVALNKCNNLDSFLDSCALHNQELDLEVLNKDIDALISHVTKCLATAQSSQIRLRKLLGKFDKEETQVDKEAVLIEDKTNVLKIDNKEPVAKDEVFYLLKTDDDNSDALGCGDVTTAPGKKEQEATKTVLNELRRKLVNREDVMRERERQALAKTMPEFKDNIPEFPRQIKIDDVVERKGYINKIERKQPKKRLFRKYKIQKRRCPYSNIKARRKIKTKEYAKESDIQSPYYEANAKLNVKSKLLTITKNDKFCFTLWRKTSPRCQADSLSDSDLSEGLSDVEGEAVNRTVNQAVNVNYTVKENSNGDARNYRFSKKDLELTPSSSEDESEIEFYLQKEMALLNDVRKYRAARRKNFPSRNALAAPSSEQDEGLRPVQYSVGAGLAMASVLQGGTRPPLQEEVFIGDGELSHDSGNDDDA